MQLTREQRIDWLERQLTQVDAFIARDRAALAARPGDRATQVGLSSWEQLRTEFINDLEQLGIVKLVSKEE